MYKLRTYQQEAVNEAMAWVKKNTTPCLLELATGCHEIGHKIMMADGSIKNVEDVEVGDQLMGVNSQVRTVIKLHRGNDDMYKITPVKGSPFCVNSGHIFSFYETPRKKGESANIFEDTAFNIHHANNTKKHRTKLRRAAVEQFSNEVNNFDIPPYMLGALLGDGHLKGTPSICSPDFEIVDYFQKECSKMGLSLHKSNTDRSAPTYYINDLNATRTVENKLVSYLKNLDLFCKLSGDKFIPAIYKTSSINNRLEVLAGLIDTDGYYDGKCIDYVSKSKQLADDVVFICRSLGFAAQAKETRKGCQNGYTGVYYRVCISGDIDKIPCKVKRKKPKPRKQIKNVMVTGFKTTAMGKGDYYGFELDGDRLYLDGDFIVHHNSGKSLIVAEIAKNMYEISNGKRVLCLAPSAELTQQNFDKFMMTGEQASIYSASISKSLRHPVIYATPLSFKAVAKRLASEFCAVILDECFHGDTMILTKDGYKKISDKTLMDSEIACFNESTREIQFDKPLNVWSNGTRNVSQVNFRGGSVICTSTHKFYVEGSWVKAENIKIGQKMTLEDLHCHVLKKLLRASVAVVKKLFQRLLNIKYH